MFFLRTGTCVRVLGAAFILTADFLFTLVLLSCVFFSIRATKLLELSRNINEDKYFK